MDKYTESLFTHSILYFASPLEFNDPFDCKIFMSLDGDEKQILELYTQLVRAGAEKLSEQEINQRAKERLSTNLHKHPSFLKEFSRDITLGVLLKYGLCCFGAKNDDILMFSHYSDGHKGFCVEFEANHLTPFFGAARKVKYEKEYPVVNFHTASEEEYVEKVFFTKSDRWAYEEEWRIVEPEKGSRPRKPGPYRFPRHLLTGVIFGCRMPEEHKDKIRAWLKGRKSFVKLYQAEMKEHVFGLDIVPID